MSETSETSALSRGVEHAADWAADTAAGIWKSIKDDPVHAAEVTAAGLAVLAPAALGLGLRLAGYGLRPLLARAMWQEAAAAGRAAGVAAARDDITGFAAPGPLKINGLMNYADQTGFDRAVLLSDLHARAAVPLSTFRSWVADNAVNGEIRSIDGAMSVARLRGGSGVVMRSDLDMSVIRNTKGQLQIADHASGEAHLYDGFLSGNRTVVFPNGRVLDIRIAPQEQTRMTNLYYGSAIER